MFTHMEQTKRINKIINETTGEQNDLSKQAELGHGEQNTPLQRQCDKPDNARQTH